MNRIIWMGIGVAIGVIAFRKVTEAQSNLGPEGLNRAVGRLADGLFDFAGAVREGMQERETELRAALGSTPVSTQASTASTADAAPPSPAGMQSGASRERISKGPCPSGRPGRSAHRNPIVPRSTRVDHERSEY